MINKKDIIINRFENNLISNFTFKSNDIITFDKYYDIEDDIIRKTIDCVFTMLMHEKNTFIFSDIDLLSKFNIKPYSLFKLDGITKQYEKDQSKTMYNYFVLSFDTNKSNKVNKRDASIINITFDSIGLNKHKFCYILKLKDRNELNSLIDYFDDKNKNDAIDIYTSL